MAYGDPTQIFSSRCLIVRVKKYARYEIVPAGSGVGSLSQTMQRMITDGIPMGGEFLKSRGNRRLAAEARNGGIKLDCLPSGRLGGGPGREWRRW